MCTPVSKTLIDITMVLPLYGTVISFLFFPQECNLVKTHRKGRVKAWNGSSCPSQILYFLYLFNEVSKTDDFFFLYQFWVNSEWNELEFRDWNTIRLFFYFCFYFLSQMFIIYFIILSNHSRVSLKPRSISLAWIKKRK